MTEKKAFEKNEVMLWGINKASQSLLDIYDKGNKNPKSKAKIVKNGDTVKVIKKITKNRVFDVKENYTIDDLDFLNKEYDRIDEEASKLTDFDKMDELVDIQDKLYDIITKLNKEKEKLEEIEYEPNTDDKYKEIQQLNSELDKVREKYIQSRGDINLRNKMIDIEEKISKLHKQNKPVKVGKSINREKIINDDDCIVIEKIIKMVGKGFKKGSPEALLHAEKMRKALEIKKQPKEVIQKKETKARVQKGSAEAKELSRKLIEARKIKQEAKKKELEEEKRLNLLKNPIKPKGRPWFYIGDIPKGYREATELEAIKKGKVSKYGKYQVDGEIYRLYTDYDILLDQYKNETEITWTMNGLKKRILKSLSEIEILQSKIDNDKYKDKLTEFKNKLELEKDKRKHLQAGWNWYYKIYCNMKGIKYERQKFSLPKKEEIKFEETTYTEPKKIIRPIDPRTGKEAIIENVIDDEKDLKKEEVKNVDVDLLFKNGLGEILLSTKYFTNDYKLKSKYVPKLLKKNITLHKKHYTTEDYNKYFYTIPMKGGKLSYGELEGLLDATYNDDTSNVNNFIKDEELSTGTSKVFINPLTGQTVVAHRGTKEASDWLNNAVYALGNTPAYKLTPRYQEAKKVQKEAYKKYGKENITTIGHSQGGLQAELLGKKGNEIITLNKATRPFGNISSKNQYDISTKRDIVSSLNPFQSLYNKGKTKTIKSKSYNPITEHMVGVLHGKKGEIGK